MAEGESYLFPGELRGRADDGHAVSPPLADSPNYFIQPPSRKTQTTSNKGPPADPFPPLSHSPKSRLAFSIPASPIPPLTPAWMGHPNSTLASTSRRVGVSIWSVAASHSRSRL